jgi:hypothetical protein
MEKEQNKDKISVRPQNKKLKPFKKGDKRINRKGHPLGQKNYATIRAEAIIAIGKQNGKTPEEIEIMLVSKGVSEAMKGDYRFYKDDLDRVHGTATQKTDITSDGKGLFELSEKLNEWIKKAK